MNFCHYVVSLGVHQTSLIILKPSQAKITDLSRGCFGYKTFTFRPLEMHFP